jgi:hypothetical protein
MHIAAGAGSRDGCDRQIVTTFKNDMILLDDVKSVVVSVLPMRSHPQQMDAAAPLPGAVPELDASTFENAW